MTSDWGWSGAMARQCAHTMGLCGVVGRRQVGSDGGCGLCKPSPFCSRNETTRRKQGPEKKGGPEWERWDA
jgi:hypothetical protein